MRRLAALAFAATLAAFAAGPRFKAPEPGSLTFPRDHGSHDEARVEWWYVTGHLAAASGRRLGYQLTFFRTGLVDERKNARASSAARDLHLAHFARTDVAGKAFRYAERMHRGGLLAAFASEERLDVANEEWRLTELGGRFVLTAKDGDEELALLLEPEKPPVLHGRDGMSRKGAEPDAFSRYVSFTRLRSSGWWTVSGRAEPVTGSSWLDHEWGAGAIGRESIGWDWFGLQLADGRDLMLYRMRSPGGRASPFASGTLVAKDGAATTLSAADFSVEESARWKSPRSAGDYPARWTLRVPSAGLTADVVPLLADQELVTARSTRVTYWEGACEVRAEGGAPIGRAYVELTGYAGRGALGFLEAK